MRLAYLINQYPAVSHSFVRREIQALERQGVAIMRYAIRPSVHGINSDEDRAENALTRHIVTGDKSALATAAFASLLRHPLQAISTLVSALGMGRRSEAGLMRHVLYWVEALIIADWLRGDNVEHIHAHFGTNSATVAMLASQISRKRFSLTVHGPEEFDKPDLIRLPHKIERASFVIGVSAFGVSQLRRLAPYEFWSKLHEVHCGIEPSFWEGAPAKKFENADFVSVGRLTEQKGQMTLVEAAKLLKQRGRTFHIRLVGDGELRAPLEAAVKQFGLENYITFYGWRTPSEVREEILAARTFVLPSYAEGLPVSIMEAFALGAPVISTYVAGIPELVIDSANGWLAPAGDAERLADAMESALDAPPSLLTAMGEHGMALTRERHHIDIEAAKLKSLFENAGAVN